VALLREATGLNEVEPDRRPWIGAVLMLDAAIGTKSIQRICLQQQSEDAMPSRIRAEDLQLGCPYLNPL
jgi:hypothetical protein